VNKRPKVTRQEDSVSSACRRFVILPHPSRGRNRESHPPGQHTQVVRAALVKLKAYNAARPPRRATQQNSIQVESGRSPQRRDVAHAQPPAFAAGASARRFPPPAAQKVKVEKETR